MRKISIGRSRRVQFAAVALAVIAVSLPTWASAPAAAAGSFVVDDPGDAVDADTADGECVTAADTCTLRAAVMEANATGGTTTVDFDASVDQVTLSLGDGGADLDASSGDLNVTNGTLVVNGRLSAGGPIRIDAVGLGDRHFAVAAGARLELSDVQLSGGAAGGRDGGAVSNAGELVVAATPTDALASVPVLIANSARRGGAIHNTGEVTIRNDSSAGSQTNVGVSANSASEQGGAIYNEGGTVRLQGSTTSSSHDVYADNNTAGAQGGALVNDGGETVIGCRVFLRFGSAPTAGNAAVLAGTVALVGGGLDGGSADVGGSAHVAAGATLAARPDPTCNNSAQITRSTATFSGGAASVLGRLEVDTDAQFSITGSGGVDSPAGGGLYVTGAGAVQVDGVLVINGLRSSGDGGGLLVDSADAAVRTGTHPARIELRENAARQGAGIAVTAGSLSGEFLFESNTASERGGALSVTVPFDGADGAPSVELLRSRFVANLAPRSAAIHLDHAAAAVRLANSTVSANVSDAGAAVEVVEGRGAFDHATVVDNVPAGVSSTDSVTLRSTLLAANGAANCIGSAATIVGGSHNLADDTSCHPSGSDLDLPGRYAELRSLLGVQGDADYWLLAGHPAIDAVDPDPVTTTCLGLDRDQIDGVRPVDGDADGTVRCDIGAIEIAEDADPDDPDGPDGPDDGEVWPVSGTVYDESTGRPLAGVCVFAGSADDPSDGEMMLTGSDGTYSGEALDNEYLFGFFVPALPADPDLEDEGYGCGDTGFSPAYQPEWYRNIAIEIDNGQPVFPDPTEIDLVVVDGAAVTGVDACLGSGPGAGLDAPCGPAVAPPTSAPPTASADGTTPDGEARGAGAARGAGSGRSPSALAFVG